MELSAPRRPAVRCDESPVAAGQVPRGGHRCGRSIAIGSQYDQSGSLRDGKVHFEGGLPGGIEVERCQCAKQSLKVSRTSSQRCIPRAGQAEHRQGEFLVLARSFCQERGAQADGAFLEIAGVVIALEIGGRRGQVENNSNAWGRGV